MAIQTPIVKINNYPKATGSGISGANISAGVKNNSPAFKGSWALGDKAHGFIKWVGGFSTPANRFFLGATALATQPWIDLNNKKVDEKTRNYSCARTIAKIVVGTITGVLIRKGCIDLMKKLTYTSSALKELEKKGSKISEWLTALVPTSKVVQANEFEKAEIQLKKFRNTLGSIVALGVMLFTNFLIDAPLTKMLTNYLINKIDPTSNQKGGK